MATIYDIDPTELIEEAAKELQKIDSVKPPEWAIFVKTGHFKERPPARSDWWYVRAAAVLRKVYRFGPIGVSKLRGMYGGKKNAGAGTEHFYKGSGNAIRKVLQQLEKAEFLRQGKVGVRKGRMITPKGKSFLNKIATKLKGKGKEVKVEKKEAKPAEAKPKAEVKKKAKEKPAETKEEQSSKPKEEKPKAEEKPKEEAKAEAPKAEKPKEAVKKEEAKPKEYKPKAEEKKEVKPREEAKPEAPKKEANAEAPKAEEVKTEKEAKPEPKEQKTE